MNKDQEIRVAALQLAINMDTIVSQDTDQVIKMSKDFETYIRGGESDPVTVTSNTEPKQNGPDTSDSRSIGNFLDEMFRGKKDPDGENCNCIACQIKRSGSSEQIVEFGKSLLRSIESSQKDMLSDVADFTGVKSKTVQEAINSIHRKIAGIYRDKKNTSDLSGSSINESGQLGKMPNEGELTQVGDFDVRFSNSADPSVPDINRKLFNVEINNVAGLRGEKLYAARINIKGEKNFVVLTNSYPSVDQVKEEAVNLMHEEMIKRFPDGDCESEVHFKLKNGKK